MGVKFRGQIPHQREGRSQLAVELPLLHGSQLKIAPPLCC